MRIITDIRLDFNLRDVYRLLGYRSKNRPPKRVRHCVNAIVEKSLSFIKPKILLTGKNIIKVEDSMLLLSDNITFKSTKLAHVLSRCGKVVLFLCTIGKGFDAEMKRLMRQNRLKEAYILDAVGSVAVEKSVNIMQGRMDRGLLRFNRRTTMRFSPGYCDWRLEEQRVLFSLLDNNMIDVELTSGCLMSPRKSVSGVMGVGEIGEISNKKMNPCESCCKLKCKVRRSLAENV